MVRSLRLLALAAASLLTAASCDSANTDPCAAQTVNLSVTVMDDGMEPSSLTVCRGQEVALEIQADASGEFHIHGYDDQVSETELTAGETTEVEFIADAAGQFIIEFHPASGDEEIEIGVLTVNEP